MGLFKRIGKAVKRGVAKATRQVERSAKQIAPIATMGMLGGKGGGDDDEGTRSQAAAQLMKKDVQRQAGSGQISFTEEKPEGT